jgi:glycosyltransferase 2 family protein
MLLGVAVYGAFAFYRGWAEMADGLSHYRWSTFVFACALALGNYLLRYLKWEYYLRRLEIRHVPKLDSLLTFLSGLVLTVTPAKVGEVFKSIVLHQTYAVAIARTAPIVLAERMTDVLGIVLLIVAGSVGFAGGLVWAFAGTALVLVALLFIGSDRFANGAIGLLARSPAGSRRARLAPKVREAWMSLRTMTTPRALIVPTIVSVAAWFMECLALWVVLHGFGERTPVSTASFFYATATLAGALVPVPGGLGVTEASLQEQLSLIGGVGGITSTCAMILVRFATLWFAVLVGFIALTVLKLRHEGLMEKLSSGEGLQKTDDPSSNDEALAEPTGSQPEGRTGTASVAR